MSIVTRPCAFCGKSVSRRTPGKHNSFCNYECKSQFQRLAKPVTKEWLEQKYSVEKMDCTQISKIVHRDPKSVWNWLKDFGIETRKRGTTGNGRYAIGKPHNLTDAGRRKLSRMAKSARKKDGHVPYLKNGVHHLKGKRGADTPNWKGGITPERQAFYSSLQWKRAVKAVWKRDNATCQRCGKHHNTTKTRGTFCIHHIVGFENKKLRARVSNLVLLCRPCHLFIHSRKNVNKEFIK